METSSKVVLYGWDLKGFPKPVLRAWTKVSQLNENQLPERLIHVGVAVYQKFYHFNQKGCQIAMEIPQSKIKLSGEEMFTEKAKQDFEKWLEENKYRFSSSNYHPKTHNCIDFAKQACKFLGVPFPSGLHTELNEWLKDHKLPQLIFKSEKILLFLGCPFGSSSRTFVDGAVDHDEEEATMVEDELIKWEPIC